MKAVTYGGYLNISQQLLRHEPSTLDTVFQRMRRAMSRKLEAAGVTELTTGATTIHIGVTPTGDVLTGATYDASAAVFAATGMLAQWAVMGPLGWAKLGQAVDDTGRPLLPFLSPVNAQGSMQADTFQATGPAGLSTVVTHAIADDTIYVGNSDCVEAFIHFFPLMGADEPSILGRQVAISAEGGVLQADSAGRSRAGRHVLCLIRPPPGRLPPDPPPVVDGSGRRPVL